jgi:hypothetical protein
MVTGLVRGHQLPDGDYSTPESSDADEYGDIAVHNGMYIREVAGREGTDNVQGTGTASRTWLVSGSADPLVCREALVDGPVQINEYDGLFIESLSRERQGPKAWLFTANYTPFAPDVGEYVISVDTTGGSILRTVALSETRYGSGAPNFGGAIDVQDGVAQGCEIVIPAMKLNVRARIKSSLYVSPMAYANTIALLTGTVNANSEFGGAYAAGELLFLGATGDVVGKDPTLTFSFAASPNLTGQTLGGISGIAKGGHQYLWTYFESAVDSGVAVRRPKGVYVNTVYRSADWTALKIGVTT